MLFSCFLSILKNQSIQWLIVRTNLGMKIAFSGSQIFILHLNWEFLDGTLEA